MEFKINHIKTVYVMPDNTISLYKLKSKLNEFKLDRFSHSINQNDSVTIVNEQNPKYVEPIFSLQQSGLESGSLENATIILISAAGATGKTCLTENLSYSFGIPIFDLSKHEPVASNSLTGLLFNSMDINDFTDYTQSLKSGKGAMIIDALDEGFIKTTADGFYAFLDNVINIAKGAKGVPFVMLGRTNIVELTTLYLEEKGLNVAFLQIEPFTIESAKEFIDKHIESDAKDRFKQEYQDVRDYIVEAIGGFFKDQTEMNHKQYLQFIGYAPVLLAIATLLNRNSNYHALLETFRSSNRQNIKLIIDIIEEILRREKEDKIGKLLLPKLLESRDDSFKDVATREAYSEEEQCIRLLCRQLNGNLDIPVTGDVYFDTEYNKQISSWLNEHPFLSNGKIQNGVFESYIIAKIIKKAKHRDKVFQYLRSSYRNAYMLFYIYNELANEDRDIDKELIPYLFDSLKALDKKGFYSSMELTTLVLDGTSQNVICELTFFKAGNFNEEYNYYVNTSCHDTLYLGADISNLTIDLPLTIGISSDKVDFTPPAYIKCNAIECSASEILLNVGSQCESVVLECDNFNVKCGNRGTLPVLTNRGSNRSQFQIICKNQLTYPFVEYVTKALDNDITSNVLEKYHKMRRLLMMFRSHSKGSLARFKEKIDNRIGKGDIGREVLDALIKAGILYSDEKMYFIDSDKMAQKLGVKYDDIRSSIINDKIKQFLS